MNTRLNSTIISPFGNGDRADICGGVHGKKKKKKKRERVGRPGRIEKMCVFFMMGAKPF